MKSLLLIEAGIDERATLPFDAGPTRFQELHTAEDTVDVASARIARFRRAADQGCSFWLRVPVLQ
jgi:hypothetical protein